MRALTFAKILWGIGFVLIFVVGRPAASNSLQPIQQLEQLEQLQQLQHRYFCIDSLGWDTCTQHRSTMAKDTKRSKKIRSDEKSQSSRSRRGKSPKRDKRDKSPKRGGKVSKTEKGDKTKDKSARLDSRLRLSRTNNPENVLEYIPEEYVLQPETAEPLLHFLPRMVSNSDSSPSQQAGVSVGGNTKFPNLKVLLSAAEDDIRLHRARVQAAKATDISLLRRYVIESDDQWLARQQRLNERDLMLSKLNTERAIILRELGESSVKGLTAQELTQVQLARWQRALELFVYAPPTEQEARTKDEEEQDLEFLGLLDKLLEGITEVSIHIFIMEVSFHTVGIISTTSSYTFPLFLCNLTGRRYVHYFVSGCRYVQHFGRCYQANCKGCD
jgi:hypothetical protein